MRKYTFIFVALLVAAVFYGVPASDIKLDYVQPSSQVDEISGNIGTLFINLDHMSTDPKSHFINEVCISVNGGPAECKSYNNQSSKMGIGTSFNLNLNPKDEITVYATSSIEGESMITTTLDELYGRDNSRYGSTDDFIQIGGASESNND